MAITIGFAYNQKPGDEKGGGAEEPPSEEPPSRPLHDRYAEWDDAATIAAVEAALSRAGQVIRLEADASFPERLRATKPDIVFNIAEGLHGRCREAHVPAICEFFDIPHTASDPLTLTLALDKQRAKEAFFARGVATPAWCVLEPGASLPAGWSGAGPWFVKPLFEGSSMGIPESALCADPAAVERRGAEIARDYGEAALVEEFLSGREFTVAILGNGAAAHALPLVEILFDALPAGAAPVYGYEAKWIWDTPERPLQIFRCPADVDDVLQAEIERVALAAYHALGCRDWSRVDIRLDSDKAPNVIEVNPLPGILPDPKQNSCFPKAARAAGMSYDDLIVSVLDHALARYGMQR